MSDMITTLRQDLTAIASHADAALSALDLEDDGTLLWALGEMNRTMTTIKTMISASVSGTLQGAS